MTDFADEARTRKARMLRMAEAAAFDSEERRVLRARVLAYTDRTPEPPVMSSFGVSTKGCSRCQRTMWHQAGPDGHYWVCASCGAFEDMVMRCPQCAVLMRPPKDGGPDRWSCPGCKRTAGSGWSDQEIESTERQVQEAISLLDDVIAQRKEAGVWHGGGSSVPRVVAGEILMGQDIQTQGCSRCGGTMCKTVETDGDGKPTSESQFVCGNSSCGNVA